MTILHGVILGIIQGLAEFLPISSSGHLVLFQKLFGIEEPGMIFDVTLHLGTLIPIFIVFWDDIFKLIKKPLQKMSFLIVVGTLPAVVFTLLFKDYIDMFFESGKFLSIGFFVTAIVLIYSDRITQGHKKSRDITYADALFIGCVQAIAIMPGISRSGSTISGSLFRKLNREAAAKFSFLLSIPAVLGAVVLQIADIATGKVELENLSLLPMAFGFLASMLSGYLAIKFMLRLIKRSKLSIFAYYVAGLGVLILIDQFVTNFFF